ncbi:phage cement protein [Serratia symbiotica]|uniref:gp53 minor capsid family protein n=1 Tax=Serratia symbiotica TaxID=138074 RepID=UPI003AF89D9D
MSNAYLYRMLVAIAGAVSRPQDLTIEPVIIDSSRSFPVYGLVGKYDGDYFVPLTAGDTAEKIQGIYMSGLIRPLQPLTGYARSARVKTSPAMPISAFFEQT